MEGFSLNSIKKKYVYDQDKIINPEETVRKTFDKLRNLFPNKKFEFKNVSNNGFEVYDFLDDDYVQRGKGATETQSRASAIMEFVERFSWKNFDYLNNNAYHKLFYSQLKNKDKINFDIFVNNFLRGKNDDLSFYLKNICYDFLEGISLIDFSKKLYPLNFNNVIQTSNGMCTGNCKEEAILQGLCEIVERHNLSFFLNNLGDLNFNLIDLKSIKDKLSLDIIKKLLQFEIEIYAVDLTLDLDVPTFMVCGVDNNLTKYDFGYVGYGYGTQGNPEKALLRALTEYVQMRELNEKYDSKSEYLKKRENLKGNFQFVLKDEIFEKIKLCNSYIPITNIKDISDDDFLVELNNIVDLFKEKNFDVIVIDKTLPSLNIPVFRVWSPNLLPGMGFDSNFDNLYLLVLNLIYESEDLELSNKFFRKYFDEVFFSKNDMTLNLVLENNPYLTRDILRKYLNPDNSPLEFFLDKTYLDYINHKKK